MPTFNDPATDVRETVEALRGLAAATRDIAEPDQLGALVEQMHAATQMMSRVLDNLGDAHTRLAFQATGDGDPIEGLRLTTGAQAALREARGHLGEVETSLEAASERSGQIDWKAGESDHRWISVVFFQGEEAEPVLEIINRQGTDAAIEYLVGWDTGLDTEDDALENGYVYGTPPQSPSDKIATRDIYALTYNPDHGYVGLTRQLNYMPDPELLGLVNPAPELPATEAPTVEARAPEAGQGRHRGDERQAETSWFRPDAINDIEQSRGLSL